MSKSAGWFVSGAIVAMQAVTAPTGGSPSFYEELKLARAELTALHAAIADIKDQTGLSNAEIVAKAMPATLDITAYHQEGGQRIASTGSGWFFDEKGNALTAMHVIAISESGEILAPKIFVTTSSGENFRATVVGVDPRTDLAVLHIDRGEATPYLPWATDDAPPRPGDKVFQIGNPLELKSTVTYGHVSFVGRSINGQTYTIQHDAVTNPGSSGAPLLDKDGRVIGLTYMSTEEWSGLAFTIPAAHIRWAALEILDHGKVITGQPGFTFENATNPDKEYDANQSGTGAVVLTVDAESAAARSGLENGDIIVFCGDSKIATADNLSTALYFTHPGDTRTVTVMRNGEQRKIELVLGGETSPLPPKNPAVVAATPKAAAP